MRMFLQLEGGESVVEEDVIGIFDMDGATVGEGTRLLLREAQKEMRVVSLASDLPRSLIVVKEEYGSRIYISGLSAKSIAEHRLRAEWLQAGRKNL